MLSVILRQTSDHRPQLYLSYDLIWQVVVQLCLPPKFKVNSPSYTRNFTGREAVSIDSSFIGGYGVDPGGGRTCLLVEKRHMRSGTRFPSLQAPLAVFVSTLSWAWPVHFKLHHFPDPNYSCWNFPRYFSTICHPGFSDLQD